MSADKKPKRRQKKNSEVSQFVTRFRVQPPETHSAPEPHSSQGALKFFHWKYNEEDSIITDDATSVPTYPDQDLPQRHYSSSNTHNSQPQINSSQSYAPRAQRWIQDITMEQQMAQHSQAQAIPVAAQMIDSNAIARQQSRQQQLELLYKQRGQPVPIQAEPQQPAWNKAAVAESYAQQYFGAAPLVDVSTFLPWMSSASLSAPATPGSDAMDVDSDYSSHSTKIAKMLPAIPEKRVPLGAQHVSFPDGTSNRKVPVGGSFTPSQHSAFKPIPSHNHQSQPSVRQGL